MGIHDISLYDVLARNALIYENRPAWYEAEEDRLLTYGQLKAEVDRWAARLQAAGLIQGGRVGLIGKNSLAYFLVCGAAAALGAMVVPINWRLSAAEAAFNLNDVDPFLVLAESDDPAWLNDIQAQLSAGIGCYNLLAEDGLLQNLPSPDDASLDAAAAARVRTDDGAVIIHTAAVAGRPRGAVLSHGNMIWANLHLMQGLGVGPETVYLNVLPLFHVGGLCVTWMALHLGALVVNVRKFDAPQALALIARHKASLMFEFAPMLDALLAEQERTGLDISSMTKVAGLDAPQTIERYQQLTGGTYYSLYGQTETAMVVSLGSYNACPGAAGRPLPLTRIAIVDDDDRPVADGGTGEIVIQGPMVFKGYWGLAGETEMVFRNGWHHTGDLGRLDEQGYLWYGGRKPEKELIKPGGENVYPAEVENVILQHPAVDAVVVFGVPDPKWKEGIMAVCRLKSGQALMAEALIAFVGERIARYKRPHYVEFVSELALKSDGQVDREAVKKQYA